MKKSEYIISNDSNCKYCYKCLRNCPVKAISFNGENSFVIEQQCILCGTCVGICPQHAKNYRKDIDKLDKILGNPFIISIAPSFYAHFDLPFNLIGFLKSLGCINISETAIGAEFVNISYNENLKNFNKPFITSACPVVVNLIEKYYPDFIDNLMNIQSPAIAHSKFLSNKFGDIPKIFIGPCIAKKEELKDYYDIILTFEEIDKWILDRNIDISNFEKRIPDSPHPNKARMFPTTSGILFSSDNSIFQNITIEGVSNIIEFLEKFENIKDQKVLIEMSACVGSCLNGPAIRKDINILNKKNRIQKYYQYLASLNKDIFDFESYKKIYNFNLNKSFENKYVVEEVSEEEIESILKALGKNESSKELNCTGCGYETCREKAKAVILKKAEKEMCFAYLIEKVSSFSNKLVDETPNAIVIYKNDKITYLNPAAKSLFNGNNEDFILKLCKNDENCRITEINLNNKKYYLFPKAFELPDDEGNVVLFVDITEAMQQKEKMNKIKLAAIEKIEQVLNDQMKLAQNIAGLLGESIAETKSHFSEFKKHIVEDENVDL